MADFDRTIPPGGEGKVSLKVNLKNYQGKVQKSAVVFSNDPQKPRLTLYVQGKVQPLIEVRPGPTLSFRGLADQLSDVRIDLSSTTQTFHIQKLESNLEGKVDLRLETVEDGKHYRIKVANLMKKGMYQGFLKAHTDLPKKPEIVVRIYGNIEAEIAVRPTTLLVGKLDSQSGVRLGKILVLNNRHEPFQITRLSYDEKLITVTQQPLPQGPGFSLEINPKLENMPQSNQRLETRLVIETDKTPEEKHEVRIYVVNMLSARP